MHSNWSDINPLDLVDTDKMMNSLFNTPADNTHTCSVTNNNNGDDTMDPGAFAAAWPDTVSRSLSGSDASNYTCSPSGLLGVSPSVSSQYHTDFFTKSSNAWPPPSNFAANIPSSAEHFDSTYAMLSDSMLPSLSHASIQTPSDAGSLRGDVFHPFGAIPDSSMRVNDMMEIIDAAAKNVGATPQLSPASFVSQPSPLLPNTTLTGYHTNIASGHAAHLADLVKDSNILNAGHSGPRSLASSLSRSVLSADAIGRPDASAHIAARTHNNGLTIQQRRRLSLMARSPPSIYATSMGSEHPPPSPIKNRRRLNSAPDPSLPHLDSSPEVPKTPLTPNHRRPHRGSISGVDELAFQDANMPASIDDADSWMDAVIAHSHDLVFVLSLKGTVLYISPSVKRILGFHPEEIIGRPLVDFCHPADIGPFSRELKEAITLPSGDEQDPDAYNSTAVKAHRRVDLIMRMSCKNGTFSLIETTGRVSVDPPKHRKVVVCSGRPHPVPMLPWTDVRQDLLTTELSAWLKISHNGIFLGSTGPIQKILGIEDINLLGRHVRDLPMVTSSSDLLDALRSGRCISVQDHYESSASGQNAPVKLTVYPWTSNGRSNSVSFVHVQQRPGDVSATDCAQNSPSPSSSVPTKRKEFGRREAQYTSSQQLHRQEQQTGSGSLTGSATQANGTSVPVMTANDAANTVFSELTGFHSGSWLIEMQRLHNTNRKLRHELSALTRQSSQGVSVEAMPQVSACF